MKGKREDGAEISQAFLEKAAFLHSELADTDLPAVCVEHQRFIPCRHCMYTKPAKTPYSSQREEVLLVKAAQALTDEGLVVVLPEVDEDMVSRGLRLLTRVLEATGATPVGGGLGGEYGYGVLYENDVFGVHPYCWCEQDDCAWCRGCTCPDEAYEYQVDGVTVEFEDWIDAGHTANRATLVHKDLQCDYCKGDAYPAPNFWHKTTGTRISWYKYIGRGMKIHVNGYWGRILTECLASIPEDADMTRPVLPPA